MSCLEELIMICHGPSEIGGEASEHDLAYFTNLLTQMLKVDPSERITPRGILEHPFITMSHLQDAFKNGPYVKSCMDMMSDCQDQSFPSGKDGAKTTRQTSLNKRTSTSSDGNSRSQKRKRPY
nr:PREDICTED: homeodomain-interacting protein kinase 2-like [Paralichthys olivaceus]